MAIAVRARTERGDQLRLESNQFENADLVCFLLSVFIAHRGSGGLAVEENFRIFPAILQMARGSQRVTRRACHSST